MPCPWHRPVGRHEKVPPPVLRVSPITQSRRTTGPDQLYVANCAATEDAAYERTPVWYTGPKTKLRTARERLGLQGDEYAISRP